MVVSAQGIVYGKPVHQGITALKPTRNLKNLAEERVGRKIGGLRILNSYWVNQVGYASAYSAAPSFLQRQSKGVHRQHRSQLLTHCSSRAAQSPFPTPT